MKVIDRNDFLRLTKGSTYYGGRWVYIRKVTAILKEIQGLYTGIELGCHLFSVMKKGLTVDINSEVDPDIVMDAACSPWSFRDDCFDIMVALQVLEHIPDRAKVWNEIQRIARCALITLPYKWDCPEDKLHHGINDEVLDKWFEKKECVRAVIPNAVYPPKPRVLLCFDFTKGKEFAQQFVEAVAKTFKEEGIK